MQATFVLFLKRFYDYLLLDSRKFTISLCLKRRFVHHAIQDRMFHNRNAI